jgi:hypothetical protein
MKRIFLILLCLCFVLPAFGLELTYLAAGQTLFVTPTAGVGYLYTKTGNGGGDYYAPAALLNGGAYLKYDMSW